jgi:hypothetical protein
VVRRWLLPQPATDAFAGALEERGVVGETLGDHAVILEAPLLGESMGVHS